MTTASMTGSISGRAGPPADNRFPLGLCAAGIITTSLGLAAAALDIRWGAAPAPGDALRTAWVNVNVMLMLTWLVVWPALALRHTPVSAAPGSPLSNSHRNRFLWDFAALAAAAIPALGVAAFLSGATASMIAPMLALQIGVGIFVLGMLTFCVKRAIWEATGAGILAALAVAAPVAVYLWSEFFSLAWSGWYAIVPSIAIIRAAHEGTAAAAPLATACLYAISGIILWIFRPTLSTT